MNSLTHLYCILSIVPVAFSELFFTRINDDDDDETVVMNGKNNT